LVSLSLLLLSLSPALTAIYTLSLHDALPISSRAGAARTRSARGAHAGARTVPLGRRGSRQDLPHGSVLREPAVRAGAAGTFPPLHARGARAAEEHPRSALPARRGRAGAVARRAVAVPR